MKSHMAANFLSLSLSPALLDVVEELGYEVPTAVQAESIPLLLAGNDLIGQSKTGSGKTAAFSLPILQQLEIDDRRLQALVICPTRELSTQVARELRKLGRKNNGLTVLELVGGQPVRLQVNALIRGFHIVVGTPGRLLDHVRRGRLKCDALKTLVLDEADRMLDMGFGPDVEAILDELPKPRQTVLFSATFPKTIEAFSARYQHEPLRVTIDEPAHETPTLRQVYVETEPDRKLDALFWAFGHYPHESALIFCNFKATVAKLRKTLVDSVFSVDRLDGDLEQFQRDQVLAKFRNRSVRILIATDVAGRGIDVKDLELVINYEFPPKPETYVHRIGRTGRAGKAGVAVSLVNARELVKISALEKATGESINKASIDTAGGSSKPDPKEAKMRTILISGGRKDKVRPGDILGALTGEAGGLSGGDIGQLEIFDRLSYVAVDRSAARSAAKSINLGRIKGKRFRATLL